MKSFIDFDIKPTKKGFTGDKIRMDLVLNVPIIIHDYKIEPSKYEGDRLDMQIEKDSILYLLWSSSKILVEMIHKVPKEDFPFKTTIIKKDKRLVFS